MLRQMTSCERAREKEGSSLHCKKEWALVQTLNARWPCVRGVTSYRVAEREREREKEGSSLHCKKEWALVQTLNARWPCVREAFCVLIYYILCSTHTEGQCNMQCACAFFCDVITRIEHLNTFSVTS